MLGKNLLGKVLLAIFLCSVAVGAENFEDSQDFYENEDSYESSYTDEETKISAHHIYMDTSNEVLIFEALGNEHCVRFPQTGGLAYLAEYGVWPLLDNIIFPLRKITGQNIDEDTLGLDLLTILKHYDDGSINFYTDVAFSTYISNDSFIKAVSVQDRNMGEKVAIEIGLDFGDSSNAFTVESNQDIIPTPNKNRYLTLHINFPRIHREFKEAKDFKILVPKAVNYTPCEGVGIFK